MSKDEVMHALIEMITDVLGDEGPLEPIEAATSFRDGLGFNSIQFIALAELIQQRYEEIDFVTWIQSKEISQVVELRVGDVADFVVAA